MQVFFVRWFYLFFQKIHFLLIVIRSDYLISRLFGLVLQPLFRCQIGGNTVWVEWVWQLFVRMFWLVSSADIHLCSPESIKEKFVMVSVGDQMLILSELRTFQYVARETINLFEVLQLCLTPGIVFLWRSVFDLWLVYVRRNFDSTSHYCHLSDAKHSWASYFAGFLRCAQMIRRRWTCLKWEYPNFRGCSQLTGGLRNLICLEMTPDNP